MVFVILMSTLGSLLYVNTFVKHESHSYVEPEMSDELSERLIHYYKYKNVYGTKLTFPEFNDIYYSYGNDSLIIREYETYFGIE